MLGEWLASIKVFPAIALDDARDAAPLARALVAGGVRAMEITFRTPAAESALRAVHEAGVSILLGAGTLRSVEDVDRARAAGATFGVSPGATPALIEAIRARAFPWLPGAATASEVMVLSAAGFDVLKLFPASLTTLDALSGPFPDVRWVPTGGVNESNLADYLARPSIVAVSGTWIAPRDLIRRGAFAEIERRAATAARIAGLRID
jgi:2-dehydro-3-deoxyphosphogluconate aldolase/(4S)-4-hydroxy-2-oxoglutarate aldolase